MLRLSLVLPSWSPISLHTPSTWEFTGVQAAAGTAVGVAAEFQEPSHPFRPSYVIPRAKTNLISTEEAQGCRGLKTTTWDCPRVAAGATIFLSTRWSGILLFPPVRSRVFFKWPADLERESREKEDSGIRNHGGDNLAAAAESAPDKAKPQSPAEAVAKRAKKKNKTRRRKPRSKTAQAKWMADKMKNVPAFRYRNVFKCVLRNMHSHMEKNKEELIKVLLGKGYSMDEILDAFEESRRLKSKKFPGEIVRKPKIKIDEMLRENSVRCYMLRETLRFMLDSLQKDEFQQVHKANRPIYVEACTEYIAKADLVLG